MATHSLEKLFRPDSIAVVGASTRSNAVGARVIRNLRKLGYGGLVYPVNPKYDEVEGERCYPSLDALPRPIDAVFVGIPAEQGPEVLEEAAAIGVRAAFVNASGYADGGREGRSLQRRLRDTARRAGIAVCGPNNSGLINVHDSFGAYTAPFLEHIEPGPVALIAQSGSVALALSKDERNLGLAYVVTTGNEAVVTAAEYLDYIARDDRVTVVLLFLETIRDPVGFEAAAREAMDRGKRIIAMKVGKSESGRAMVAAHTDSLAGEDRIYEAFFRALGVIRVSDLDEMLETAVLLTRYPDPPPTPHALVMTLSGGEAALVADLAAPLGLSLRALSPATVERLRPAFPPFQTPGNPLDGWGLGFDGDRFATMLDALLGDPDLGTLAFSLDAPASGGADVRFGCEMAERCRAVDHSGTHIVFFNNTSGEGPNPELRAVLDRAGIPYLSGMRPALVALAAASRSREAPVAPTCPPPAAVSRAARTLASGTASLGEVERFDLLREAGIPMVRSLVVRSPEDVAHATTTLGPPIALKGAGPGIAHKTDRGLVHLRLDSVEAATAAFSDLSEKLRTLGAETGESEIVAQSMVQEGLELIVGVRNEPGFGSFVVVGAGGVLVELLDSVSIRLGPLSREQAERMLESSPVAPLLRGHRGRDPYDAPAAAAAIAAISCLGEAMCDSIGSMEVNPLIVGERGVLGVDLVIAVRPDPVPSE